MSLGLSFWLAKRSNDHWTRLHAASDIRRRMRQQWTDYGRLGKGNRAWKRAEQLNRGWFHIGFGIYVR